MKLEQICIAVAAHDADDGDLLDDDGIGIAQDLWNSAAQIRALIALLRRGAELMPFSTKPRAIWLDEVGKLLGDHHAD